MTQTLKASAGEVGGSRRRHIAPAPDDSSWTLYARQWARSLRARNIADSTIKAYTDSLTRLAAWALSEDCDDPIDADQGLLEDYFAYALNRTTSRGRPAAPAAVAKDYRHLRVFFGWLSGKEHLAESPMAHLSAPRAPVQPVAVFTDDELRALVKACAGRDFVARRDTAIIRMLLDTGLRRAELVGLSLADLDTDAQLVYPMGKGSRERSVPYGAKTAEALDDYLRMRSRHRGRSNPALWLSDRTKDALGYDGVRLMVERRARTAGVRGAHMHRFRHTAAHAFLAAGGREGDAMRIFGWVSRSMVDRYGASASHARAIESARRLSTGDRI